jgi:hypothetical protein
LLEEKQAMAGRKNLEDRVRAFVKSSLARSQSRRRPPPKNKGGSEPVTVEPNRPKLGEGGAAAALEFDE